MKIPTAALEPTPTGLEFMDDLSYTTIIELAQPFVGLSCRSQAKTDRRGSVFVVRRQSWALLLYGKTT